MTLLKPISFVTDVFDNIQANRRQILTNRLWTQIQMLTMWIPSRRYLPGGFLHRSTFRSSQGKLLFNVWPFFSWSGCDSAKSDICISLSSDGEFNQLISLAFFSVPSGRHASPSGLVVSLKKVSA